MGSVRFGIPEELTIKLARECNIKNFVETGTYYGGTAGWAAKIFDTVTTVEAEPTLHQRACERFGHLRNLKFLLGDSRTELEKLVPTLEAPTFFWLDSHFCVHGGGNAFGATDQCPLISELQILSKSKFKNLILIDDAVLFLSAPPGFHNVADWPDIQQIMKEVANIGYETYTAIFEDVLIIVPIEYKQIVIDHCRKINTDALDKRMHDEKHHYSAACVRIQSGVMDFARGVRKDLRKIKANSTGKNSPSSKSSAPIKAREHSKV